MRRVALVLCLCAAGVAAAQPAEWTVKRDPFDRTVVARWKAILAKDPYDPALTRLVAMYRDHRSVAQLADEYRAEPETWASLVVLARLAPPAERLALYLRAVGKNERDVHGWIAIAEASTPADARLAYERALVLAPPVAIQRAVLRKLAALPGDAAVRDRAYARLVELEPKNGALWLERADALAGAGSFALAIDSYTAAEPLLKTDPERRLYAIAQRGRAHEGASETDAAIADYQRAIAESPRGYYLKAELIDRIVAIHTKAGTLPALLRELARAWPERTRGHFEWATLGALYQATGAPDAAILALQQAVAAAPTELETQRRLVNLLDAVGRPDDALVQLETAARAVPRDARIQFQLAERYAGKDTAKLLATLDRLGRALPTNAGVHHDLGDMYMKLRRLALATREFEIVVKLELDDDNLRLLGDAYWLAGKQDKAAATWQRLARDKTAAGYTALANALVEHELYDEAISAYNRALELEPENPDHWRARGAVYEAAGRWSSAFSDTDHAVALLGAASADVGHAARYQLVRILIAMGKIDRDVLDDRVGEWEMSFAMNDDLVAGYLLAEYYGRNPDTLYAHILDQLHAKVPGDDTITFELVRAHRILKHYDRAIALARTLARSAPARKQELDELIAKMEEDRRQTPQPLVWTDVLQDPEDEIRAARPPVLVRDAFARGHVRGGMRIGLGTSLRGPSSRALTMGAIGSFGTGPVTFVTRVDVAQRSTEMRPHTALGGSVGLAGRVLTTPSLAILLGAAQRFEHRFGDMVLDADRTALAADVTLDLVARSWPTAIGARFEQGIYRTTPSSTLLVEMSIELR